MGSWLSSSWARPLPGIGLALILALASYWLATLPGLKVMGALTVALLVGITWRATAGMSTVALPGTNFTARSLLRTGIVLMGARLDFALVAQAGPKVLFLDVLMIVLGIAGIAWIARRFSVDTKLGMLVAIGTSICGASAVVAAASVTKADEETTTLAVALMGILGTLGVLFFVLAGPFLGLSTMQLAILSGSTLHEVAQVMAAAFTWGEASGAMGTLVKLTRVVLLAPALLVLGVLVGSGNGLRFSWKEPPIPWFVMGFIAVGVLGSIGVMPSNVKDGLASTSVFLMVMAMAAMGLNTKLELLKRAGMRVVYAGLAGFTLLTVVSWLMIKTLNIH
jgi:uncharacterized integral membrane protein (TIGR00698 family)